MNRFFLEKCGELESALDKCTQGRPNAAGSDAQGQDSVDSTRLATEVCLLGAVPSTGMPPLAHENAWRRQAPDSSQQDFYEAYRDLGRLQASLRTARGCVPPCCSRPCAMPRQTFVWINTKGFQKIMKKCAEMLTTLPHVTTQMRTHPRRYDKRNQLRGSGRELGPEFEKRLEKESFCSGKIEVLAGAQKRAHPPPCLCRHCRRS